MLSPLVYHQVATDYFRRNVPVWTFFANPTHQAEQLQDYKINLLKSTYQFDKEGHPLLFQQLEVTKQALGLSIPISIYQAENAGEMNASIVYVSGEAHVVFTGKILDSLSPDELLAILGHELSHVLLYQQQNGDIEVVDRIVSAIGAHTDATPAHYETARLFRLYTEIYCDRGAYQVTKDHRPIISSLVKIATGLQTVNAESFVKQAEEVFANNALTKTSGVSHPENFIRARALWLWHEKGPEAEPEIQKMIEGHTGIDELDLFKQLQIADLTRKTILALLQEERFRTPPVLALANQYYGKLSVDESVDPATLGPATELLHPSLKDYLGYVLYDFATTDKELGDVGMGRCFQMADELKIADAFAAAVKKEQKLTDKKVSTLRKNALNAYQQQLAGQL
ncbi:M48 family metalloprotease [Flaviaesturariibacter aridisoli]|uniref:Peptidase M48 n=1 Tax=Flaviaesturariibacter aridisoli TaxID=2545761 RepID=A0A4V2WLX2_9BACT|nr:M48 family metalloprotease [Flaviaesturariibacter aridisoli]TCZ65035.1 peptidase M48 [Flaviaesturariibacter aridisoli]